MPYLFITLFMAPLPVPLLIAEWVFSVTGSGLSVTDGRGVGQVTGILIVLLSFVAFNRFVARDEPFGFIAYYARRWRLALRGFAVFAGVTVCAVLAVYAVLWLAGSLTPSTDAVSGAGFKVIERTLAAFVIVVVIAVSEEILFRTILMRYLRWNTTPAVTIGAVVFSSFVFAVSHRIAEPMMWFAPGQWQLFTGLFLLGVLLATTYVVTGSFLCSTGLHAGLLCFEVVRAKTGLLEISGTAWWTGPSEDVRMAPLFWLLLAGGWLLIFAMRHRLHAAFAVERPVVQRGLVGGRDRENPVRS